jgi:hypothetical protein
MATQPPDAGLHIELSATEGGDARAMPRIGDVSVIAGEPVPGAELASCRRTARDAIVAGSVVVDLDSKITPKVGP